MTACQTPDLAPCLVVLPRTPGPIRPVGRADGHAPDDLDAVIDELFGETTAERPGHFDLGLIGFGVGLSVWSLLLGGGGLVLGCGLVLLLLGVALPARSLFQAIQGRHDTAHRRRVEATGFALDIAHPATAALVAAYDELLTVAGEPGAGISDHSVDALDAAHLALVEAATLLDGSVPTSPAELAYVDRRTAAIRELTAEMRALPSSDPRRERAAALASARDELESLDRLGSLDRLEGLRTRLQPEFDDARS